MDLFKKALSGIKGIAVIAVILVLWYFPPTRWFGSSSPADGKGATKKVVPKTQEESAADYKARLAKEFAALEHLQKEMYDKKEAYIRDQLENSVPKNLLEEKLQEAVLAAKKKWDAQHLEALGKLSADKAVLASAKRELLNQEKSLVAARKALEKEKEFLKPDVTNEVMKDLIRKHFEMEEMIKDYLLKIEMAPPTQRIALRTRMAAEQRTRFAEIQSLLNSLRPGVMAEMPKSLPKKK